MPKVVVGLWVLHCLVKRPARRPAVRGRRDPPHPVRNRALADDTFRRRYAQRIGAEQSTLIEHAVLDPAATVTRDVERLRSAPAISPRVTVSGHVYDVVTGLVQTVIPACSSCSSNR